jgi:hypothetical protein
MTSTRGLAHTAHLLRSFIFNSWVWDQVYLANSAYVPGKLAVLSELKDCVGRNAFVGAVLCFTRDLDANKLHVLPQVLIIKLTRVDFAATVPFALIADDVTDVAPRDVTPPVTVCVRLVLSAADVVAAMSVECV